ncbi:MAG: type VI secretion system baseplate subunit TssG [Phycisphaerales bacterium]|nr:MAG: type VI secretion system baseplate subunit TssG [Phycisphaerales bacterium]
MEEERRAAVDSLARSLSARPYEYDFFQAVRRIECVQSHLPLVGHSQRPQEDAVRFRQRVSMEFCPASVAGFEGGDEARAARMAVNFFGLLGTNGPMPLPITEYVYDRLHNHGDRSPAKFLDIFDHRMISLFYRAWACNQQTVSHDRKEEDRFAVYIGSLFGIGQSSLRERDRVPDVAKLHYSGRLACPTKNAEGLRSILRDYFGIPAAIDEFVGQWISLAEEHRCKMGSSRDNGTVGSTLIVGSCFWECQQKFRIKLGPMNLADYERMLPGGDSIRRLVGWVRNYVGDQFGWELQLILAASEVPCTQLGKIGQLGWSTWLSSKKFEEDADDLTLRNLVA